MTMQVFLCFLVLISNENAQAFISSPHRSKGSRWRATVVSRAFELPNFELPKFELPNFGSAGGGDEVALGDTIGVVGASGNVGRLVALRLSDQGYTVRAVARNADRAASFFEGLGSAVEVVAADTTQPGPDLLSAVDGCAALVICTGTTAFPTLAWRGGNTPEAVDNQGVKNVLEAWEAATADRGGGKAAKRCVLMSSIGVERRDQMPFVILNACGVLDAKAAGEQALREAAADWLGGYAIVRPGQLIGGPYDNNYYLGTLAKLDRPARSVLLWDDTPKNAIEIGSGDELLGDTLRSTVAELLVRSLLCGSATSSDFAVVNVDGPSPSDEELSAQFAACA